jgi:hypothetical protein
MAKRINDCFQKQVDAGRITRSQARVATERAMRLKAQYSLTMPPDAAEARAMVDAVKDMQQWTKDRKLATQFQALRLAEVDARIMADPEGASIGAGNVMLGLEKLAEVIKQRLIRAIGGTVYDFNAKYLGFVIDRQGARNIVEETFGVATGNAKAAEFAKGFARANDMAVNWINEGGGMLHKLVEWRLPQRTNRDALRAVGKDKYVADMLAAHDAGELRLLDFDNGLWFSPGDPKVKAVLETAYDNLTAIVLPTGHTGTAFGGWNEARVFHWQTADGWLKYNDKYGVGDAGIYDALMGHVQTMARDVATISELGPTPQASIDMMLKRADAAERAGAKSKWFGQSGANFVNRMWQAYNGSHTGVGNELVATVLASVRHTLVASKLGGMVVGSVFGDTALMTFAAAQNRVPVFRLLKDLTLGFTRSKQDTAFMRNFEFGNRYLIGRVLESGPHTEGALSGVERFTASMADVIIRVQGGKWWTETAKAVFGMNYAHMLGTMVKTPFDKLDPVLKRGMAQYGISAAEWDIARAAPLLDNGKGVYYFDWGAIPDRRIGDKLGQMMLDARSQAVLEPGIQALAITTAGAKRGTWAGESARAVAQFKSFSLTMMMTHLGKMMQQEGIANKAKYFGGLALALTAAGAATIQVKQLLSGKDPRDMSDWKFWPAAFVQGGGAGLYGDFFNTAVSARTRGDIITAAAGPTVGVVADVIGLASPDFRALMEGRRTGFGAELTRFLKANTPGTNLFYTRLMLERGVWDNLQYLIDPEARRSFARQVQNARRDYGQKFYSPPGEGLGGMELPDPSAALGR